MSARAEDLERLILDIHAAPMDPPRWQSVVESACQLVEADRALLFSVPQSLGSPFWSVSTRMSPAVTEEYAAEFAVEDVWMLEASRRGATSPGTLFTGEELIDRRAYMQSRFFNEFLIRHDIDRFMNVALLPAAVGRGPAAAALSLYRGVGKEAFGALEREILGRLVPHLILAVNSFWKVQALSVHNAMYSTSLDAVSTPLFVLDQRGRVVFANAAAVEVIRGGELLRVVDGMLEPSPWMIERKACLAALQKLASGIGSTVCLTVGERRRQVLLSTAPMPKDSAVAAPWGAAAGLVWLAPFARKSSAVKRISAVFGLSSAEETLLAKLAAGATLGEAAEALCVSIHTVRTQLKSIQRKTGWRTQGELVRMVQQLGAIEPR